MQFKRRVRAGWSGWSKDKAFVHHLFIIVSRAAWPGHPATTPGSTKGQNEFLTCLRAPDLCTDATAAEMRFVQIFKFIDTQISYMLVRGAQMSRPYRVSQKAEVTLKSKAGMVTPFSREMISQRLFKY